MNLQRPLKEIPVVRLSATSSQTDYEEALALLGAAFEDIGFCSIEGHGISFELLTECYMWNKKFFELPAEVKQRYARPNLCFQRGWTPPYTERAIGAPYPDSKENLFFGMENPPANLQKKFPMHYHENIWPDEVPELRAATLQLFNQMLRCGETLVQMLGDFLAVGQSYFLNLMKDGPHLLRPLYYPAVTHDNIRTLIWGGEHTDLNFITILPPSTASGLMIRTRSGQWISGRAPERCVIAQVGDELQYMTGERFLSAVHRVDAPQKPSSGRYSTAFFVHARSDRFLSLVRSCAQTCKEPGVFKPVRACDFVDRRLREINLAAETRKPV